MNTYRRAAASLCPAYAMNSLNSARLLVLGGLLLLMPIVLQARMPTEAVAQVIKTPHVEASLISRSSHVVPGQTLDIALRLQPDEGWHTYWKNPGDTGLPTRIEWRLPQGFRAGEIEWPVPERIDYQGMTNFGFHGDTWLLIPLAVPVQIDSAGQVLQIDATAKWLVCREVCIPGEADFSLTLPIAGAADVGRFATDWEPAFRRAADRRATLVSGVKAEFAAGEQLKIEVDTARLPSFNQKPEVFLATKGVVSNAHRPRVGIEGDTLFIVAEKDPYLEELPNFISIWIVSGVDEKQQAWEILASHNPRLSTAIVPDTVSSSSQRQPNLLWILLFALLGGFILNAMPCVFPVLSLKIVSLVESGNHSVKVRHQHGQAYTAGVVFSFLLVASVLIALRFFGQQVGWGFQLQSPWFVGVLVYVLFVLGLSMSGVIEIGSSLQNLGASLTESRGETDWRKSFFTGVLATVVATPCTAPFMGTAMSVALSQPVYVALLVFAVMGLGLSLPFLLIAYIPALANALPAPGNWMVRLKEILAFPIYLTVVWLLWVFSRQTGSDATAALLVGLVLLAFAAWLWRVTLYRNSALYFQITSLGATLVAALMLGVGVSVAKVPAEDQSVAQSGFTPFSEIALQQAIAENDTVFVNMTADWCITCKVNERVALNSDKVKSTFSEKGVTYIKGDWTNSDATITAYLEKFNRNGVPLYVVYKKGEEPEVLPQILTPDTVLNAIN